ncbi:MAG: YgiT-type zinc finger protein [Candidatus Margulisbacteria bacterium]|nr:YgiT-type zinc finger protein [Candidatus Margulisiibacteriota bacterium]
MNKYADCYYCGGPVTERKTAKPCLWGEQLIAIVDKVPTGVCEQCGEKYYKAIVLKLIDQILKHRTKIKARIQVPLADFSKATA